MASDSRWRFGVDTSQVPIRSSRETSWDVTPGLMTSFRQLAEVVCPILSRCRSKCQRAKLEGSLQAFEAISARLRSFLPREYIDRQTLTSICHALLSAEEALHQNQESGPRLPDPLPALPPSPRPQRHQSRWDNVDTMYTEPEFRLASQTFTKFYRHRTMEVQVAYVCGYRDALADIMQWNNTAPQPTGIQQLLAQIASMVADLCEIRDNPFNLETVQEQEQEQEQSGMRAAPSASPALSHASALPSSPASVFSNSNASFPTAGFPHQQHHQHQRTGMTQASAEGGEPRARRPKHGHDQQPQVAQSPSTRHLIDQFVMMAGRKREYDLNTGSNGPSRDFKRPKQPDLE